MTQESERRLHERLDKLTRELIEANRISGERLIVLETQRIACMDQCQRVCRAVFGNGTPGLMEQTRLLERTFQRQLRWFWLGVLTIQGVVITTLATVIARLL